MIITLSIWCYLRWVKNGAMAKRTTTLITRIIKLTVETGFLCAAVNTVAIILFLSDKTTLLYMAPIATTSKLYSNCLLAVSQLCSSR